MNAEEEDLSQDEVLPFLGRSPQKFLCVLCASLLALASALMKRYKLGVCDTFSIYPEKPRAHALCFSWIIVRRSAHGRFNYTPAIALNGDGIVRKVKGMINFI